MAIVILDAEIWDVDGGRGRQTIVIEGDRVVAIRERTPRVPGATRIDARGAHAIPGLVDVHCDVLEDRAMPHPRADFEADAALAFLDSELASCGIATQCHAISLEAPGSPKRSPEVGRAHLSAIAAWAGAGVRHRASLRCELTDTAAVESTRALVGAPGVAAVVLGEHAPADDRYGNFEKFVRYCRTQLYMDCEDEIRALAEKRLAVPESARRRHFAAVASAATEAGRTVFADGSSSVADIEDAAAMGASAAIFPRTKEAAKAARSRGLAVCVGAPNVVRGGSHKAGLSAACLVREGLADVLVADFHSPSMLMAPFTLARDGVMALPQAIGLVSRNPARLIADHGARGRVAVGERADLAVVRVERIPRASAVLVSGRPAFASAEAF